MALDWQVVGPWSLVAFLALLAWREVRRGDGWTYAATEARRERQDAQRLVMAWMEAWMEVVAELRRCNPDAVIPPSPLRSGDGRGTGEPLRRHQRRALREAMAGRLAMDELRNACFDLGCEDEGATTPDELIRRLVDHVDKQRNTDALVAWLKKNRPDIQVGV